MKMSTESGRVFGYARVSTQEQNLDRQLDALEKHVPKEQILYDKVSGKDLNRPSYQALKGALGLREGDTLYITSLDRLSRNKKDIKAELDWFRSHRVRLKVLDLPTSLIDVGENQSWILEMITNILIEVISSLAEQERITIKRRQREGIDAAKRKGKHLGRPALQIPDNFTEVYLRWKKKEITARYAMKELGMSRSSFYRVVQKYEDKRLL